MPAIYEPLGSAITGEIDRNSWNDAFLSRCLASRMDMTSPGVNGVIHYFKQGYIYGTQGGSPSNPEKSLERLSILLYALNFSETYPAMIDKIKGIDDRFKFPPENGISYEEVQAEFEAGGNGKGRPKKGLEAKV